MAPAKPTAATPSATPDAAAWSPANGPARKLDDYRDARRAHVMRALGAIGIRVDRDTDEDPDHTRYSWALVGPNDPDPPDRIELLLRAIHQRRRWRAQYDRARSATDDQARPVPRPKEAA